VLYLAGNTIHNSAPHVLRMTFHILFDWLQPNMLTSLAIYIIAYAKFLHTFIPYRTLLLMTMKQLSCVTIQRLEWTSKATPSIM